MNCPKCAGYLERDYQAEFETRSKPSYKCMNCSLRLDQRILINQGLTPAQQSALPNRVKGTPQHRGVQTISVLKLVNGGVICDSQL